MDPRYSPQLGVLAQSSSYSYNLPRGAKRKFDDLSLCLGNEGTARLGKRACDSRRALAKAGLDLELSLSVGPSQSAITAADLTAATAHNNTYIQPYIMNSVPTVDEGSTSARRPLGGQLLSFLNKNANMSGLSPREVFPGSSNRTQGPAPVPALLQTTKSPAARTSGFVSPQQRRSSTKICSYTGCAKGARGSSGRCIKHGGGRRCQKEGCGKGAEGKTIFCKAHGGGKRCEHLGCTKCAEGRTEYCIAHGGGRRCSHEGCKKAARGKSGLCIKHGGGKRCRHEECTKSAEGRSGLCIAHGGGRRCQHAGCGKGAQGSTDFCKAHGGGKRCTHPSCTKGAEGSTPFCKGHGGGKRCSAAQGCTKSVHGGTQFCVAHGGGKRCVVPGCTKSARGSTDRCVGHGGGKRCKSPGCDKSAQGSTNFCKAHGGGRRCLWGHPGSDLGVGSPPCEHLAARGKKGLCVQHNPVLDDDRVHGGRTLGAFSIIGNSALAHGDGPTNTEIFVHPVEAARPVPVEAPEGRVHGGNIILSMFANVMSFGDKPTNNAEASSSAPRNWKSTNDLEASTSSCRNWL